jgi:four helix bundle protein
LVGFVYDLTRKDKFSRDFGLAHQIQDAAGSVIHNIAEGFEAGYDAEFVRFLKMARRSEVKYSLNSIWHSTPCISQKSNSKRPMTWL